MAPMRVQATGKQKTGFLIHLVIYAIGVAIMAVTYTGALRADVAGWAYPWHAWIIAAWGLALIGHWCVVYRNYSDAGHAEYRRQEQNG